MSYEGFDQCICQNGHYFEHDCYDQNGVCPHCHTPSAWSNGVDDTNGDDVGFIPYDVLKEKFLLSATEGEKCNLGHWHVSKEATYRIPTSEETAQLRKKQSSTR